MKNILLLFSFFCLATLSNAQYKAVSFDYEKVVFGENQPLPAEAHIMLQGETKANISLVEIDIYEPKGKNKGIPLYTSQWKRSTDNDGTRFMLPINYKLKGSSEYDLEIKYYTPLPIKEKELLAQQLHTHLHAYLEQVIGLHKNSISLEQNERQIIRSLNKIVHKGLDMYRNRTSTDFEGFSDMIKQKFKQISSTNLAKGKLLFQKESSDEAKSAYRTKLLTELKTMISSELNQYFNLEWYKMIDNKYIDNYSTEQSKRTIAIQAGFGGVYLSSTGTNVAIGASPYVGFAFPLSKRTSNKFRFLNNLSINLGVFLMDMQGPNNSIVSGPIFKRPTYIGLSYKIFRFIHINAGAAFLEDATTAGQFNGIEKNVYIRPYIGISAQIDLWMDFSK